MALGRRLFPMLPEDAYDLQPLRSRDGRLTLVADIRLDNRDELIVALGLPSGQTQFLCDAALLLESLARWGEGALDRIVGDFAFALWDGTAQKLLLARDFLGQRPLHYHRGSGFFAFASMPKGLHALAEIPYGPDEEAVVEALARMPDHGSRTYFKNIERVESAHVVTVTREGLRARRYWQPQFRTLSRAVCGDYVDGLRHHLDQATRSRLRGVNGVVGAHLSGGLDSSAVAATAARLLATQGGKVVAFTAVCREGYVADTPTPSWFVDGGPLAAATASMYRNIEHVPVHSGHLSPLGDLDRAIFFWEWPPRNLSPLVWGEATNKAAHERNINIMLTGSVGNGTISYDGLQLLPELLSSGRLLWYMREASKLVANTNMGWRSVIIQTLAPFMPAWLWQWANRRKRNPLDNFAIRPESFAEFGLAERARKRGHDFFLRWRQDAFSQRLRSLFRQDFGNFNKGTLGGWGIDQRDPTADQRLVEYCLGVPTGEFLTDGTWRSLARRAFADRLPQAVVNEKKAALAGIDWHEGFTAARFEVAAELDRLAAHHSTAKILDIDRMKALMANWPESGWNEPDVMRAYKRCLLVGIGLGHFLVKTSGSNR